jgi:GNAT superfamily N-acetyltransferase
VEASRPATAGDVPRLTELVALATAELVGLRGGVTWAAGRVSPVPVPERLAAALADPEQLVLAGTIDGALLGYAWVRVAVLGDGTRLGVVEDLFVEAEARGVGLGEAMMGDVLAWCRARGCAGVDAIALPGHRATKNFFEESGFTARLLVMHRRLGAGDAPA